MQATSGGPRLDTQPSASSEYPFGTSRRRKPPGITMPNTSGESQYFSGSSSSSASPIASPSNPPPRGIAIPVAAPTPHWIEITNVPTPPNRQRMHHHAEASNQATIDPSPAYLAPPLVYEESVSRSTLPRAPRPGELGWVPPELRSQQPNPSHQQWPETSSILASQRTGYPPCPSCGREMTLNHWCERRSSEFEAESKGERYQEQLRNEMTDEQHEQYGAQENKGRRARQVRTVESKERDRLAHQRSRAAMTDEQLEKHNMRQRVNAQNRQDRLTADKRKLEAAEHESDKANAAGDIGEKRAKKDRKKK